MAQIVNTFGGGMDKDTNPNSYKSNTYYHAENLRLIVDNELSSGTLSSTKKHEVILGWGNLYNLVGFTTTYSYLVFFLKGIILSYTDRIILVAKSKLDTASIASPLNITNTEVYSVKIEKAFAFGDRVEAIARQETEDILKVYWVDNENPVRFCNLLETGVESKTLEEFEIVPNAEFGNIKVDSIINGTLKAGAYQYAYAYYNLNGSESSYSPPTAFFPLSASEINSSRSYDFKGSPSGENTSKGLRVTLENLDTSFDRLRIVRIYRISQEATPEINIIYEGSFISQFEDTGGNTLGTIITEELIELPNIFRAKTLETKNNFLFAGNIVSESVNLDWLDTWDSRTYRYLSMWTATELGYWLHLYNWNDVTDSYTGNTPPTIGTADYDKYTLAPYNKISEDGNTIPDESKYQSDGVGWGGEGEKITYSLTGKNYVIDDGSSDLARHNSSGLYIDNFERVGYQSDEIYRFGIIFWDDKGRHTPVKWIGDIRMPSISNGGHITNSYNSSNGYLSAKVKGIKFTIDTTQGTGAGEIPEDIVSFSIVRAVRTSRDSTVMDTGYLSLFRKLARESFYRFQPIPWYATDEDWSDKYAEYICPETLINGGNDILADRLDIYKGIQRTVGKRGLASAVQDDVKVSKLTVSPDNALLDKKGNERVAKLNFTTDFSKLENPFNYPIAMKNAAAVPDISESNQASGIGNKGTTLVLGNWFDVDGSGNYPPYCIRRKYITPYSGTSPSGLEQTQYIICPDSHGETVFEVNPVGDRSVWIYGGDTYISTCEIQRIVMNFEAGATDKKRYANVVLATTESKINFNYIQNPTWTSLDSGESVDLDTPIFDGGNYYHVLREKAGVYDSGDNTKYVQDFDLYTYNPVYSPINNIRKYIPKPTDFTFYEEFKSRVSRTGKKFNGEQSDSWTKFRFNDVFDVPSEYGEITKLIEFNDKLMCIQSKGVGVLPIEERELVQSQNTSNLGVGTGGVLNRIDYFTTSSGTNSADSVLSTPVGLYYIDEDLNKICKLGKGLEFISDTKGMFSYLENSTVTNLTSVYNPILKEVFFNVGSERLVFNEYLQGFTGFYKDTSVPKYLDSFEYKGDTYYLGAGGTYIEGDTYLTPKLEIISNPSNTKVGRFDSIGISSYSDGTLPLSTLQCITGEGQDTSSIPSSNFRNRMRVYRCNTLRNNSDKSRLISHYLKQKYTFQEVDLKVYDITTTFTPLNM